MAVINVYDTKMFDLKLQTTFFFKLKFFVTEAESKEKRTFQKKEKKG